MTSPSLFHFTRRDTGEINQLIVDLQQHGAPIPPTLLGNFLEHISAAMSSGLPAQLLLNPTFAREHNLTAHQLEEFLSNGQLLVNLYLSGGNPAVLRPGWHHTLLPAGFGVGILDDATKQGVPLGWGPVGYHRAVGASLGRVGGAVRLQGGNWPQDASARWPVLEDGPAGIRQGLFLPVQRCLDYNGTLWVRISSLHAEVHGELEVGFRRRIATPDGRCRAGECLAATRLLITDTEWGKSTFQLTLPPAAVTVGEPVDFYLRWIPRSHVQLDLLIDRAELYPNDAIGGFDLEVVQLARAWPTPLLRWPGGNFVSHYHWRDGVGPVDLRPTCPNRAWGGIDDNSFGTDEFIRFCQVINAEPQITVNAGTGTAEEAAAWVEYCNGPVTTPMGRLRARNGHPEPYNVRLWEVGNEHFGFWQGGYHGSEENARRFAEFAEAMRAASPLPLELIACGNNFNFAEPGPRYDHAHADRRWHERLLTRAPDEIDYISLHSLPANDLFLEHASNEQAHNAVLAQVVTWERTFLPDLLARCDRVTDPAGRKPIRLALTEWGTLGMHPQRLMVENFGAIIYGGTFLHMLIRNAERMPIANATGFLHGGCIRKAAGVVYHDPQYLLLQQYAPLIGAQPLACHLTGGGYDVTHPADLGATEHDVAWIDAVVCQPASDEGLWAVIANRNLTQAQQLQVEIPGYVLPAQVAVTSMSYRDITAQATPVQFDQFQPQRSQIAPVGGALCLTLPPFSVTWVRL